ncbi:uncharacterized protein LOC130498973 [Raphanus sativus]|uniref:Uncharacterized protein LOC130498973 n=1 Tax=Raphanus sativus TaxID=3726 RepID=A0A9W3CBL1_RAPSA|nr:uncharacterized protein LOC130498973 [Raphanus sativus]
MVSGIPLEASVSSITSNGHWNISSRSRHPILRIIRAELPPQAPQASVLDEDSYIWRNSLTGQASEFSVSLFYATLYSSPSSVSWHKAVWFKKRIPRHAFITWLVMRDRMVTREAYFMGIGSFTDLFALRCCVWRGLLSRSALQHPQRLQDIVAWLSSSQINGKMRVILHLIFQASIYHLWKERNSRIHTNTSRPSHMVVKDLQLHLRTKLYSLDREDSADQRNGIGN